MKATVTNNGEAPYGVELEGGGYRFLKPGETRTLKAANPRQLEAEGFLAVELTSELAPPPKSLTAKVADPLDHDGNGRKGGSRKGTRRRRKAPAR